MDIMTKARAGLILDHPFYGSLSLRMRLIPDPACDTAATDGKVIRYNPKWVETLTIDEAKGLICHEVMHCANQHHLRRDGRDPKKWNLACDYAIDPIIAGSGMQLPGGGHVNPIIASGASAERIYAMQPDAEEDEGDAGGSVPSGSGDGKSKGKGSGKDPGNYGAVEDAKSEDGGELSESQKREAEQDWKVAMVQAATQAKAMGSLPAGIDRLVEEIVNPKLDWRELLRQFVTSTAKNDYSWTRPNRRYVHLGTYYPGMYSDDIGDIAIAVDTSGSIRQESLNQFSAEVSAILADFQADCDVMYVDAKVAGVEHVDSAYLPLALKAKGGGGTDFRPPFSYIRKQGMHPACMIYFTDGYCDRFPAAPDYPVLWVIDVNGVEDFKPPFGDVVNL